MKYRLDMPRLGCKNKSMFYNWSNGTLGMISTYTVFLFLNLCFSQNKPVWHAKFPSFSEYPSGYFHHGCPFHFTQQVALHGKNSHNLPPIPFPPNTLAGLVWCLMRLWYCDGLKHCKIYTAIVVRLATVTYFTTRLYHNNKLQSEHLYVL